MSVSDGSPATSALTSARPRLAEELTRIVAQIRARWPQVEIVIRGDSGFCREDIMAWCEANGVHFPRVSG